MDPKKWGGVLNKTMHKDYGRQKQRKLYGINKYQSIGLKSIWLEDYLLKGKSWLQNNHLGNVQFEILLRLFKDAEIIDLKNKKPNELYYKIKRIFEIHKMLCYQIIWINLFYHSTLFRWYLENIPWKVSISYDELLQNLVSMGVKQRTAKNALASLSHTLSHTLYFQEMNLGSIKNTYQKKYIIEKQGTDSLHPIAVLYCLYRYAIGKNQYHLRVSEFYQKENNHGGPYVIFGISRPALENQLRGLQETYGELIKVDLIADLDNIYLSENIQDYAQILDYVK